MKSMPRIRRWIVATAALLTMPAVAEASCLQGNAAGQWMAYSMNSAGQGVNCRILVSATGTITSGSCTATGSGSFPVQSGSVRLANSVLCTFTGSIRFNGLTNTVRHATMSRDKTVVEGLGSYSGGQFVFSMVKI
jgi:hypothetical protein